MADGKLNPEFTRQLHQRLLESRYDAITYVNDYENEEGIDPICHIVPSPNQIKSIQPEYGEDGGIIPLSRRFNPEYPKFRW